MSTDKHIFKRLMLGKRFSIDALLRVSSQKYIPEIDALRFLAIMPVLLMHFGTAFLDENGYFVREVVDDSSALRQVTLNWDLGVKLFFGISGFVLTYPFFKKGLSRLRFNSYFKRRLVRIEPPYIIALTLFLLVHIVLDQKGIPFLLERYGFSLLYIHEFIFNEWSYILPVAWSLEIEVQFYIIMPLLLIVLGMVRSFYGRLAVYALLGVCSYMINIVPNRDLNDFMLYFLPGILVADIQSQGLLPSRHVIWSLVFVGTLFAFYFIHFPPLEPVLLGVIIFASFRVTGIAKTFTHNKLVVVIGGMCYTLYLLHYPLYIFMSKLFSEKLTIFSSFEFNYLFQGLLFIPVSIILMTLFFLSVEKPFMVLSQKITLKSKK